MTQLVELPDGTRLEFPDGMSDADMASAIQRNFPELEKQSVTPLEDLTASRPARMAVGLTGQPRLVDDATYVDANEPAPRHSAIGPAAEARANEYAKRVGDAASGRVGGTELELLNREQMDRARETAMADPVRNISATVEGIPQTAKKVAGGLIQAAAEGAGGRVLSGLPPEQLSGPAGPAERDRIDALADIGATLGVEADLEEKKLKAGLKPGLATEAVQTAIESLVVMAPSIISGGAAAAFGGAAARAASQRALFGTMGVSTFGQSYGEARRAGLDPAQAGAYGVVQAGIEVGTEFAPLRELFKRHPNVAQKFANFMAVEVPQELLATTLQAAVDKASVNPNMTWEDFEKQLKLTVLSTPLAGGAQAGAIHAAQRLRPEGSPAEQIARELQASVDATEVDPKAVDQIARAALDPNRSPGLIDATAVTRSEPIPAGDPVEAAATVLEASANATPGNEVDAAIAAAEAAIDGKTVAPSEPLADNQLYTDTTADSELAGDTAPAGELLGDTEPSDVLTQRAKSDDLQSVLNAELSRVADSDIVGGVVRIEGVAYEAVDPRELPTGADLAGVRGATGRVDPQAALPQRVTQEEAAAVAALAESLGVKAVRFYRDSPDHPDGFVLRDRDVLYLSDNPQRAATFVAAHELTHTAETIPELNAAVNAIVDRGLTDAGLAYAEKVHGRDAPKGDTPEGKRARRAFLVSELKADLGGWALNDPTFLPKVVAEVEAQQGPEAAKGVLRKLIDGIAAAIRRVQEVFGRKERDRSAEFVTNLEEVRAGLAKLYAAKFGQAEADRVQRVAEERAKLSGMQRSGKVRPYGNAPDSLMGFRKHGPQKGYEAATGYRKEITVRVTWPDGQSMVDGMRGLNTAHALERARRNWKGAEVELVAAESYNDYAEKNPDVTRSRKPADFTDPEQRVEVSTTRPYGKNVTADASYHEKWVIDGADIRASKRFVKKAADAIRTYNGLITKGAASDVLQQLHDQVVENLLWLYDLVPEKIRERARKWYDGANRIANDWTDTYGVTLRQSAGVLAALSPQMDWFKNVSLAERAISIIRERADEAWTPAMSAWARSWVAAAKTVDDRDSRQAHVDKMLRLEGRKLSTMDTRDAAYFVRAFDETYNDRHYRVVTPEGGFLDFALVSDDGEAAVTWGGFDTIEKAVSILRDGSFKNVEDQVGNEHKVRNFFNNIIRPGSADGHVTIDTHAIGAAYIKAVSAGAREVTDNMGGGGQLADTGASGLYALYADAYREAAAKRGVLPREMQSVTWEAIRALFPAEKKKALTDKVDAIWNRFKKGSIDRAAAREEVYALTGGMQPMAWEHSDTGLAAADGGRSYDTELDADPEKRAARTLEPSVAKDRLQVSLSANTGSIPGITNLQALAAAGDRLAHHLLQDIALDSLRHLLAGTSARVKASRATGLYGGYLESSLAATVTFADEDRARVLAGLAKFAENFNQEQVHVRRAARERIGHEYADGSYVTPVFRWELKKALSPAQIRKAIAESGLYGLTFGDDFVEAYYVGDPKNAEEIEQFERGAEAVRKSLGANVSAVDRSRARFWAYGHGDRAIGYERIRGDVPASEGPASKTAKRVAEYLARAKVKTFAPAEITPEQRALQTEIARAYEALPDNDLANPRVRRAYEEAAKELKRQFLALPVKVEVLNGQGEPYKDSAAMRRDVIDNNHLFIFGTTPDTFGPPGVDFTGHPLLEQSGFKDVNGVPLLLNDVLRAVHDYYAHTMSVAQFGPKGEEAAWKNHLSMTPNPWARWALTTETRGQNSWVNFTPGNPKDNFARQKVALLPIRYVLTGDRTIDAPMKTFIATLPKSAREGSKPAEVTKSAKFDRNAAAKYKSPGDVYEDSIARPEYKAALLRERETYAALDAGRKRIVAEETAKLRAKFDADSALGKLAADDETFVERLAYQLAMPRFKELKPLAEAAHAAERHTAKLHGDYMDANTAPESPYAYELNRVNPLTDTPAFRQWFRESKAVDPDGRPLVAVHGTDRDIAAFDTTISDGRNRHPFNKAQGNLNWAGSLGSWFAAPSKSGYGYDAGNAEAMADTFAGEGEGAAVYLVHLSIQNPAEYEGYEDFQDARDSYKSLAAFRRALIAAGHDGIVIRDSTTDGDVFRDDWVAFYPEQIKSAIGNDGGFDPKNADITRSAKDVQSGNGEDQNASQGPVVRGDARRAEEGRAGASRDGGEVALSADSAEALARVPEGFSRQVGPATPLVRFRRGAHPIAVVGIHYGKVEGLAALDGRKFGTGARSEEAAYAALGNALSKRVYFYAQDRDQRLPESERVVTGPYVYRALVDNLYDFQTDPENLIEQWRAFKATPEFQASRVDPRTALEHAVLASGYDGYLNRQAGALVVIGRDSVPVEPLGDRGEAWQAIARSAKARDATETEAFKKWFGESKVVDENGEPLVVYHGTAGSFTVFEQRDGYTEGGSELKARGVPAIWFTDNRDIAQGFADGAEGDGRPARVIAAHLRIERPYVIYANGDPWHKFTDQIVEAYESGQHDGVILHRLRDGMFDDDDISTVYVVFDSAQVKDVANKRPTDSPDITRSAKPVVADDRGRPLRLYHGSRNAFTRFKPMRAGMIFLTDSEEFAENYAGEHRDSRVYQVRLRAAKVADLDNDPAARKLAIDTFNEENFRNTDDGFSPVFDESADATWELLESPIFTERFTAAGYDAVKFEETSSDGVTTGTTYAVWDPNQITGRSGGADITKSRKFDFRVGDEVVHKRTGQTGTVDVVRPRPYTFDDIEFVDSKGERQFARDTELRHAGTVQRSAKPQTMDEWLAPSFVKHDVYHGTATLADDMGLEPPFTEFDAKKLGSVTGSSDAKAGFWFSDSRARARIAADEARMVADDADASGWVYAPYVYEVKIRLVNPLVVDDIADYDPAAVARLARKAKRDGHDGIVFVTGERPPGSGIKTGSDYLVFSPNQIKAADNARPTDSPDITRSTKSAIVNTGIAQSWAAPELTEFDAVVRALQDKLVDTKRVVHAIRAAGAQIAENIDPYLQETLYHGRASKRVADFALTELRPLLQDMQARGVAMQELEDFLWASHARERNTQIASVNPAMPDGGSGLTNRQAADILAGQPVTVHGRTIRIDPARTPAYLALQARIDAITNRTLDTLVSYGLESRETVQAWRDAYRHYVPLRRDLEADANYLGAFNLGLGTGQGFSVRGSHSKRAMGSERNVVDILANVAMQRERAIVRGEKNRISQALYGLAVKAPNPDFWLALNPDLRLTTRTNALYEEWMSTEREYRRRLAAGQPANDPAMTSLELKYLAARDKHNDLKPKAQALQARVERELVALGLNPADAASIAREPQERYIDPNTGMVAWRLNPRLTSQPEVLALRINGEPRFVVFSNDERAKAMVAQLKNLEAENLGWFLQNSAKITRWFASVNTQYNPVFGVVNGFRDAGALILNLGSTPLRGQQAKILKYAGQALVGIYSDLRAHRAGRQPSSVWAQRFEDMGFAGGQTGYRDMFQTGADRADALTKELQALATGKVARWFKIGETNPVFAWLSDYNTTIENSIRVGTYQAAIDAGLSQAEAAKLAKNITVNFNKKGTAATGTGALYAFFNAAVQGTARIGETMFENTGNPSKLGDTRLSSLGKKIIVGGVLLGVIQALLGFAAGWDDDEPKQFQRERNFIVPIPKTDKYVSLPMPLGYHVLPNIGRIATEFALSKGKDPAKRLTQLLSVVVGAFNPVGGGDFVDAITPTAADPAIALARNKDWTGRSIAQEDMNKFRPTPGWTRAKDTSTPWARGLSYAINYVTGGGQFGKGVVSPSPDQIDYLIGQVTGGVGREAGKLAQTVRSPATGEELPLYKAPLVGRFVGETTGTAAVASKFYANLERIGEHYDPLKQMVAARETAKVQAYYAEHPEARLLQAAAQFQDRVGDLNREKRRLVKEGADKTRVRAVEERARLVMGQFNEMVRKTTKK